LLLSEKMTSDIQVLHMYTFYSRIVSSNIRIRYTCRHSISAECCYLLDTYESTLGTMVRTNPR
jgi:hypothetical protein